MNEQNVLPDEDTIVPSEVTIQDREASLQKAAADQWDNMDRAEKAKKLMLAQFPVSRHSYRYPLRPKKLSSAERRAAKIKAGKLVVQGGKLYGASPA